MVLTAGRAIMKSVSGEVYNWGDVDRVVTMALLHENKVVINADW